jgi:ATP-dependent DNA helicase RecG
MISQTCPNQSMSSASSRPERMGKVVCRASSGPPTALSKDNIRQDDTPVHKALREAMVNALVHADYSDRASVLVIKQPTGFIFRNPGVLRVPAAVALQGGATDCRNRILQRMFLMIGLGERAGSGMAKIQRGWG